MEGDHREKSAEDVNHRSPNVEIGDGLSQRTHKKMKGVKEND